MEVDPPRYNINKHGTYIHHGEARRCAAWTRGRYYRPLRAERLPFGRTQDDLSFRGAAERALQGSGTEAILPTFDWVHEVGASRGDDLGGQDSSGIRQEAVGSHKSFGLQPRDNPRRLLHRDREKRVPWLWLPVVCLTWDRSLVQALRAGQVGESFQELGVWVIMCHCHLLSYILGEISILARDSFDQSSFTFFTW